MQLHQSPIIALDMASNGRFIMSYCEQMFVVWSLRGESYQSVLTHMSPNTYALVSPCGKFIACTGECRLFGMCNETMCHSTVVDIR